MQLSPKNKLFCEYKRDHGHFMHYSFATTKSQPLGCPWSMLFFSSCRTCLNWDIEADCAMPLSIAALGLIEVFIEAPSHSLQMQWLFYFAFQLPLSFTMMRNMPLLEFAKMYSQLEGSFLASHLGTDGAAWPTPPSLLKGHLSLLNGLVASSLQGSARVALAIEPSLWSMKWLQWLS